MDKKEFLRQIQRRVAQTAVGPSAIRNQGASGLVEISRTYFEKTIDLKEFRNKLTSRNYILFLDDLSNDLKSKFPKGGQNWGAARKGLNLFFRDVVYNKYLADHLEIPTDLKDNFDTIRQLEVPLDRDVATSLTRIYDDLPKWTTIKELNSRLSKIYQDKALLHSDRKGIARIHLDLVFWRSGK
ncbi:hypothetical protein [Mongoliibacter ruber]|uniref:Uncharacterized protein n=1 Tax=Mongoliibacter ruber TaxID=1750599 RepID=A0A2T0WK36_9BACT|nr:hypothetical protein [Mongoliibacter ruber]PRY87073.1 hypothetical protein CLW00_107142 [Mongoliibacter ruber]